MYNTLTDSATGLIISCVIMIVIFTIMLIFCKKNKNVYFFMIIIFVFGVCFGIYQYVMAQKPLINTISARCVEISRSSPYGDFDYLFVDKDNNEYDLSLSPYYSRKMCPNIDEDPSVFYDVTYDERTTIIVDIEPSK